MRSGASADASRMPDEELKGSSFCRKAASFRIVSPDSDSTMNGRPLGWSADVDSMGSAKGANDVTTWSGMFTNERLIPFGAVAATGTCGSGEL